MRVPKLVMTVKQLSYKERLVRLKLPTLKYRRIRGDMIEVYKILTDTRGVQKVLQLLDHKEEWKCYKLHFIFQYNHH